MDNSKSASKRFFFLFALLFFQLQFSFAQKLEAEEAELSNGASTISCSSCSGGSYVGLQASGKILLNLTIEEEGYYDIIINAASPHGEKTNVIFPGWNLRGFYLQKKQRIHQ